MPAAKTKSYIALIFGVVATALIFGMFSPALRFDFVNWDDDVYLYENTRVQSAGPADFAWLFSHTYFNSYTPLSLVSHAVDFAIWKFNPSGHHLTSVVLHSLNALWLFILTLQLLLLASGTAGGKDFPGVLLTPLDSGVVVSAFLAVLLYSLHPLRVESVAWVSDRKDLLCVFFLLPATICYVSYAVKGKRWSTLYFCSLILFVLACLSKSIAATLPVVFLVLDYGLLRRTRDQRFSGPLLLFVEKVPFFLVSVLIAAVAILAAPDASSSDMFQILTPMQRVFLPFHNTVFYLLRTLVPVHLSAMYPPAGEGGMMLSFALFTGISLLCLRLLKKGNVMPLLAWLCYVVMLAPSAGLSSAIIQTTADRYSYLPSIPLFVLLAGAGMNLWNGLALDRTSRIAVASVCLVVIGAWGYLAFRQEGTWANSESLWGNVINLYPDMPLPYNNLGMEFQARGANEAAEEAYRRAIKLKPDYLEAHLNLGNVLFIKGNLDEAGRLFGRAAELGPHRAEVYNNLGVIAGARGSTNDAIRWFRRSVETDSTYAQGYFNLGALYAKMGNPGASAAALEKAAELGHRGAKELLENVRN